MPYSELEELALHEAGHAVVAFALGFAVRSVTLQGEESGDYFNRVYGVIGGTHSTASDVSPDSPNISAKRRSAVVAMAGREARRLMYPDNDAAWEHLEQDDRKKASRLLGAAGAEGVALLALVVEEAKQLVRKHSAAIRAVASLLVSRGVPAEVTGAEVSEIVTREALASPSDEGP